MKTFACKQTGITLVEMAIVLVIVGLLLGGLLMPLSAQMEQKRVSETQQTLSQIQEALLGFAISQGRLPCPASATSAGQESFCTNATGGCGAVILPPAAPPIHGRCTNPWDGFLPAATLGVTPIDNGGYAIDGWQLPQNRIRYGVSNYYDGTRFSFTAPGGMRATTMAVLAPDLRVCASATGITPTTCGAATAISNNAVAIVYSLGKNFTAVGADQAANQNVNRVYVSHPPTPATAPAGEFDDIVVWLSPNILYNRMVAAGMLP